MSDKKSQILKKTLEKAQASIDAENFYEAHQLFRTVINRFKKQNKISDAKELAIQGSLELLKKNQYGSGSDLATEYIKFLTENKSPINEEVATLLIQAIKMYPKEQNDLRYDLMKQILKWTSVVGENDNGDPIFHYLFAQIFKKEKNFSLAEKHFILSNEEGAIELALSFVLEYNDQSEFFMDLIKTYFNFLSLQKPNEGRVFIENVLKKQKFYNAMKTLNHGSMSISIYENPIVNFVILLNLTIFFGDANAFIQLRTQFYQALSAFLPNIEKDLSEIGRIYFQIAPSGGSLNFGQLFSSLFSQPVSQNSIGGITELD